MSEHQSKSGSEHHHRAKVAAEVGGAVVVLASVSSSAYVLWRKRRTQARTFQEVRSTSPLIFEEERLDYSKRVLMARMAVRIYQATMNSSNNVITRSELVDELGTKKHQAQHLLSYLMPADRSERAVKEAFIDRRKGSNDGSEGYFATDRLVELLEVGGCDTLDQAMSELLTGEEIL